MANVPRRRVYRVDADPGTDALQQFAFRQVLMLDLAGDPMRLRRYQFDEGDVEIERYDCMAVIRVRGGPQDGEEIAVFAAISTVSPAIAPVSIRETQSGSLTVGTASSALQDAIFASDGRLVLAQSQRGFPVYSPVLRRGGKYAPLMAQLPPRQTGVTVGTADAYSGWFFLPGLIGVGVRRGRQTGTVLDAAFYVPSPFMSNWWNKVYSGDMTWWVNSDSTYRVRTGDVFATARTWSVLREDVHAVAAAVVPLGGSAANLVSKRGWALGTPQTDNVALSSLIGKVTFDYPDNSQPPSGPTSDGETYDSATVAFAHGGATHGANAVTGVRQASVELIGADSGVTAPTTIPTCGVVGSVSGTIQATRFSAYVISQYPQATQADRDATTAAANATNFAQELVSAAVAQRVVVNCGAYTAKLRGYTTQDASPIYDFTVFNRSNPSPPSTFALTGSFAYTGIPANTINYPPTPSNFASSVALNPQDFQQNLPDSWYTRHDGVTQDDPFRQLAGVPLPNGQDVCIADTDGSVQVLYREGQHVLTAGATHRMCATRSRRHAWVFARWRLVTYLDAAYQVPHGYTVGDGLDPGILAINLTTKQTQLLTWGQLGVQIYAYPYADPRLDGSINTYPIINEQYIPLEDF